VADCAYCSHPAYNVIEVRYTRSVAGAGGIREVLGRGYSVCDGCLALLDFHPEHHIDTERISLFNLAASVYQALGVWSVVALSALASISNAPETNLLRAPAFQAIGFLLAVACLGVWALRSGVQLRYFGQWKSQRSNPLRPKNSLAGFTNMRERNHPELSSYLPIRFLDSGQLLAKPGAPTLRCIGPAGEPWGKGPETNFVGRGANDWYRVIWLSWQLFPLSEVLPPEHEDWQSLPEPAIGQFEAAASGLFAAIAFAVFTLGTPLHPVVALGGALISWPVGFAAGRQARELWRGHRLGQSRSPIV
jgi:hypothetical protein